MASSSSCFIPSSSNCAIFLTQQWPKRIAAPPLFRRGALRATIKPWGAGAIFEHAPARRSWHLPARPPAPPRSGRHARRERGKGGGMRRGASRGTCAFVGRCGAAGAAGGLVRARACRAPRLYPARHSLASGRFEPGTRRPGCAAEPAGLKAPAVLSPGRSAGAIRSRPACRGPCVRRRAAAPAGGRDMSRVTGPRRLHSAWGVRRGGGESAGGPARHAGAACRRDSDLPHVRSEHDNRNALYTTTVRAGRGR